ncbi:MAG: sensor histidine kinase, partial [Oscillospiraceae bacterium]|nr:sensor histidine kinase [Oscillospiraceae bacterium]
MDLLYGTIGILALVILVLLVKIRLLQNSADEIAEALSDCLAADTNTLISISTGDGHIRRLAAAINRELRVLRSRRHQYMSGDRELKEAVTNISHDLRTPLTAISGYLELLEQEEVSDDVQRYLALIGNR